jgi:hypothetical protein
MDKPIAFASAALCVTLLAGCSQNGGIPLLTTQAINPPPAAVAAAPKIDPACYTLSQRIDTLRKEGVAERIEKASVGKSTTVAVKRASLAQAAELDKANAEFQAKCSTLGFRPLQAAAQVAPIATGSAPVPVNTSQVVPATAPPVPQQ